VSRKTVLIPSIAAFAALSVPGLVAEASATPLPGQPAITVDNVQKNEGDSGPTSFDFAVHLSEAVPFPVTFHYKTVASGNATAGSDYVTTADVLTIPENETAATITVLVNGDRFVEGRESFALNVASQTTNGDTPGIAMPSQDAQGFIQNDDVIHWQVGAAQVAEGDDGTAHLLFPVSTGGVTSYGDISAHYATADGTATAGTDYTATTGNLSLSTGKDHGVIDVPVTGDMAAEPNETLTVALSSPLPQDGQLPADNVITGGPATGTILDDDPLSVGNVSLPEGDVGTSPFVFTVSLPNGPTDHDVTFDYTTVDGTAKDGTDYDATSGSATIPKGQTSAGIPVPVHGNMTYEPDKTFGLQLSNVQGAAVTSPDHGTATITNDDAAPPPAHYSVSDTSVTEGNDGTSDLTFTVTRSGNTSGASTVDFATANGTATAGDDYVEKTGTVSFADGETSQTVTVTVNGDTVVEPNETLTLSLSPASTDGVIGVIDTGTGTGTIVNDDTASPVDPPVDPPADTSGGGGGGGSATQSSDTTPATGDQGPANGDQTVPPSSGGQQPTNTGSSTTPKVLAPTITVRRGRATITCPPGGSSCIVTLSLGKHLGRVTYLVDPGATVPVRLPKGRKHGKHVKVTVTAPSGQKTSKILTLRRSKILALHRNG
jgi:hypothetical protein